MSGCAARRFGPGTPCTKPTSISSEIDKKYQELLNQRKEFSGIETSGQQQQQQQQQAANEIQATQLVSFMPTNETIQKIAIPRFLGKTRGF